MTCEHDPINWAFELSPDDARDVWCALSWVEPFGPAIRTNAFRRKLDPTPNSRSGTGSRSSVRADGMRAGAQRCWVWVRWWLGKPRRLGEWRPYLVGELQPGQGLLRSQAGGGDDEQ